MNFNTFEESACNTIETFFKVLIHSLHKPFTIIVDLLKRLRNIQNKYEGREKRIISIGIDIIQSKLYDTPENKHIAFVSVDAWSKGFPNPWETI